MVFSYYNRKERMDQGLPAHIPAQSMPPFVGSQLSAVSSTQAMPAGQVMLVVPPQDCFALLTETPAAQRPGQLIPSFSGSQLSVGSSMHLIPPGQGIAPGPPQGGWEILEDFGVAALFCRPEEFSLSCATAVIPLARTRMNAARVIRQFPVFTSIFIGFSSISRPGIQEPACRFTKRGVAENAARH
jgi:hypothetical protein